MSQIPITDKDGTSLWSGARFFRRVRLSSISADEVTASDAVLAAVVYAPHRAVSECVFPVTAFDSLQSTAVVMFHSHSDSVHVRRTTSARASSSSRTTLEFSLHVKSGVDARSAAAVERLAPHVTVSAELVPHALMVRLGPVSRASFSCAFVRRVPGFEARLLASVDRRLLLRRAGPAQCLADGGAALRAVPAASRELVGATARLPLNRGRYFSGATSTSSSRTSRRCCRCSTGGLRRVPAERSRAAPTTTAAPLLFPIVALLVLFSDWLSVHIAEDLCGRSSSCWRTARRCSWCSTVGRGRWTTSSACRTCS
jgi:hypothetical protein